MFRFAVALDLVERDITADLRGALSAPIKSNYASITDPKQVGALMRSIFGYNGHPAALAALKLAPLRLYDQANSAPLSGRKLTLTRPSGASRPRR